MDSVSESDERSVEPERDIEVCGNLLVIVDVFISIEFQNYGHVLLLKTTLLHSETCLFLSSAVARMDMD